MTLVPEDAITEAYRALHEAAYDLYEQHGPLLEDDLHDFAPIALKRLMPILEELAQAGACRSREKA